MKIVLGKGVSLLHVLDRYSLILDWAEAVVEAGQSLEHIWDHYQYGDKQPAAEWGGMIVNDQFLYPGDPPQDLVFKIEEGDETLLMFPYDFIAYFKGEEFVSIGRMD